MRLPALSTPVAWLIGFVVSAAICFWPGGIALLVVAMWGGFSPTVSLIWKMAVLIFTLASIAAVLFFLARSIARALGAK